MTSTINANISAACTVRKSSVSGDPTASNPTFSMDLQIPSMQLNSTSTPVGADAWSASVALVAGAATIDLTNLTQVGYGTVNATGLRVVSIAVLADAANPNPITISPGASNGYTGVGTIGPFKAAGWSLQYFPAAIAVDATHKNLDLSGTGTQVCKILITFGP